MEVTTNSTEETKRLAERITSLIKPGTVIALYGDLGSGKTTFTSYLAAALGFKDRVQSPTFILMRRYNKPTGGSISHIYHFDLYRLTSYSEALEIGISEIMQAKDAITLIEWPEVYEENLPEDTVKMYFTYVDENSRKIDVQNLP